MDIPPVVYQDVEDREENNEECRGPSGLEAHGDHDAGGETHDRHDDTCEGPLALEDNTDEEENEKHATRELETIVLVRQYRRWFLQRANDSNSLLPAIVVTQSGQTSKRAPARDHRIGEDHQKATHHREVTEEKVDVENESVAETLDKNDTQ